LRFHLATVLENFITLNAFRLTRKIKSSFWRCRSRSGARESRADGGPAEVQVTSEWFPDKTDPGLSELPRKKANLGRERTSGFCCSPSKEATSVQNGARRVFAPLPDVCLSKKMSFTARRLSRTKSSSLLSVSRRLRAIRSSEVRHKPHEFHPEPLRARCVAGPNCRIYRAREFAHAVGVTGRKAACHVLLLTRAPIWVGHQRPALLIFSVRPVLRKKARQRRLRRGA
jgi:hypothetical protein